MADQAPDQDKPQQTAETAPQETSTQDEERVLYKDNPAMFRNHPFGFIGCWLLVIAGLVGLAFFFITPPDDRYVFLGSIGGMALGVLSVLLLLKWWIKVLGTRLTVTNERTMVRHGLLRRDINEVWHDNVRNVQVRQSLMQRIFSVGRVQISSAGQGKVEIDEGGMPHPQKIREIINDHRVE